jgi:hypothetical protein
MMLERFGQTWEMQQGVSGAELVGNDVRSVKWKGVDRRCGRQGNGGQKLMVMTDD